VRCRATVHSNGQAVLSPQRAAGRPCLISDDDAAASTSSDDQAAHTQRSGHVAAQTQRHIL